jgi:uncharacterized protein (UPF0333 family)
MTNFIKTRSFDQRNGQGGFAIGLILLVVLLIAVIVGAIAIASRSSSNSGTQEKDRVAAASLLTQAQTFNNAFTRATQGGGFDPNYVYVSYNIETAANIYLDQANLVGKNGFFGVPQINTTAYRNPVTTCPPNPTDVATNCQLWLTRVALSNPNGVSSVVYTKPLAEAVARQVNSVLWGTATNLALPSLGGGLQPNMDTTEGWGKSARPSSAAVGTFANLYTLGSDPSPTGALTAIAAGNAGYALFSGPSAGVPNSNLPAINGIIRPEGVFATNVVGTGNVYFRVLDNL